MSNTSQAKKVITLVVACLGSLIVLVDTTIVATALPTIQNSLHADLSGLQWAVDAYTLAFAALMLTSGTLGDRFGRKRLFLIGLILFLIGSAVCGFAPTLSWLLLGRTVQGIGAAALAPGSLAVLAAAFPEPRTRAQVIGIWSGVSGLGLALGPLAGGWLIQVSSWSMIFFVNLPIGAVVLLLGLLGLSESRNPAARKIDPLGQIFAVGTLVCLIMALIEGTSNGWTSPLILGLFAGSVAGFLAFLLVEALVREPMIPLGLFKNRVFWIANVASIVLGFIIMGALFFLVQFLQNVQGNTALDAGLKTLPVSVGIFAIAPLVGRMTARLGPRLPIVLGALLCAGFFIIQLSLSPDTSYAMFGWELGLLGIGCSFLLTPLTAAVLSATPPERAGLGSSILTTFRQVGISLGVAVLGAIVLQQFPGNIVSQLTQRGLPASISTVIANKIASAGAGANQTPVSRHLPLSPTALHQAIGQAFVDALHVAFLISAIALFATALLVAFGLRTNKFAPEASKENTESVGAPEESVALH